MGGGEKWEGQTVVAPGVEKEVGGATSPPSSNPSPSHSTPPR